MSKTVVLSFPHELTQAEAKARIEKGIDDLRTGFASRISHLEQRWVENHLDFELGAAGQHVAGRLDVLPHEIKLEVDLPWMLAMVAGKFTKEVEQRGRKMLEKR